MSDLGTTTRKTRGAYAERAEKKPNWLDKTGDWVAAPLLRWQKTHRGGTGKFLRSVEKLGDWAHGLNQGQLRNAAAEVGQDLRRNRFTDTLAARSFSLVREAATRTLGQRHFEVQLVGGRVLLNGMIAEMVTGEGKTLTATLAAATAALGGIPVHIITVNDYLAKRDAEWMGPVYDALGLKVGTIVHGMDPDQRRRAYRADVTYCTNKEIAFDYLKDKIVLRREADRARLHAERLYDRRPRIDRLLLRGLYYAIVDEADSVLVDEARTPLIISGANTTDASEQATCEAALSLASSLSENLDFMIESKDRNIRILPSGLEKVDEAADRVAGVWSRRQWREELVRQALTALHLFSEGKQYLIKDEKIQIIDEYTGRVMPDRSWERGLHQMIEVKEKCPLTRRIDPLARISYQRFFRRYLWLAGMTGTAQEVAGELWTVYKLATRVIPTNRPLRRRQLPTRIWATETDKWRAVVDRISEVHEAGRPVLVGTRSVEASERLSRLLRERDLPHQLLNAKQDLEEAMIISHAGERGRITVATNMAGRGTDIRLGSGVAETGGLHVIATELHEARRIDRQLFGRCGRQGDPGTYQAILSLEDELARLYTPRASKIIGGAATRHRSYRTRLGFLNLRFAQLSAERLHRRMRRDLLEVDEQLDSTLAFAGRSE